MIKFISTVLIKVAMPPTDVSSSLLCTTFHFVVARGTLQSFQGNVYFIYVRMLTVTYHVVIWRQHCEDSRYFYTTIANVFIAMKLHLYSLCHINVFSLYRQIFLLIVSTWTFIFNAHQSALYFAIWCLIKQVIESCKNLFYSFCICHCVFTHLTMLSSGLVM